MPMVIDIVRDGMATANARSITVLGEVLTDWLLKHKAEAEKTVDGKTMTGAMQAIMEVARKQGGSWAAVDDQEALSIALAYFGVTDAGTSSSAPKPAADALDLDALMGG